MEILLYIYFIINAIICGISINDKDLVDDKLSVRILTGLICLLFGLIIVIFFYIVSWLNGTFIGFLFRFYFTKKYSNLSDSELDKWIDVYETDESKNLRWQIRMVFQRNNFEYKK